VSTPALPLLPATHWATVKEGRRAAREEDGEVARVTLQTIAERVGVSRMTVSNAFSRPDQLSPALRERILAAADELGYVGPDPTARALARGSTGAIGVLLTETLHHAFVDEVATGFLSAVASELNPTGLALTLLTTATGPVIPARDVAVDGAIVYSCLADSPSLDWLRRRNLPLVYVDQVAIEGIPSVNIDDLGGARAAARHLLDLGHRRIDIVSSSVIGPFGTVDDPTAPREGFVGHSRMQGWLEVLGEAGVTPTVVVEPAYLSHGTSTSTATLLDRPDPPTAILCFSDAIALEVVETARARGLRVPEDLSVVGFDDAPAAARADPPLTTVRQDVEGKGRAAVAALVEEIRRRREGDPAAHGNGHGPAAEHIVLPTHLVIRGSTAAPSLVS
jgi:DNA-binding LacI/PurR family transcriptional regulator